MNLFWWTSTFIACLVEKLKKAGRKLSDQQLKLKVVQTAKGKKEHSIERKMFKMLKGIGVELSCTMAGR
jgi:hypothetical protein